MRHTKQAKNPRHRRLLKAQAAMMLSLVLVISLYFTVMASAQCTYTITDGDSVTVHTSAAADVDQVLEEAGIDVGTDDLVTSTGSGSSAEINIQRSHCVTVTYQGTKNATATYDTTVQDLLGQLDIALSQGDVMTSGGQVLSVNDKLYDGMDIDITNRTQETVTETVAVPYDTTTYLDPTLEVGTTLVKTQGVDGQKELTYCNEYVDGQLTASTLVGTRLLSAPVDEVILQGSKMPSPKEEETAIEIYTEPEPEPEPEPVYEDYGSYDDYEDSSSDYEDDSYEDYEEPSYQEDSPSGNTFTTASGQVLSYVDCLTVEATAYTGGGTTATGTPARYGAIAVDPKVIPYGTKMYIVSEDGKWIYGEATAEDCGGAIKGNIIDLYFDDYNTCIQFGRRNCTVYILEWG